jgi:hypothetical protein
LEKKESNFGKKKKKKGEKLKKCKKKREEKILWITVVIHSDLGMGE